MAGGPCGYDEEALATPGQRRSPPLWKKWRSGENDGARLGAEEGRAGSGGRGRRRRVVGEAEEETPTAPSHIAPPSCLCCPKRVSFGRGILGESEPTGEEVVGAGPGGDWVQVTLGALLRVGKSMGRRRRTACAIRPFEGGVARVGVGRFRCGWLEAGRREVEEDVGGRGTLCSEMATGGCSCTAILVSCPARGGVARRGSGQLRAIERGGCQWTGWVGGGGG